MARRRANRELCIPNRTKRSHEEGIDPDGLARISGPRSEYGLVRILLNRTNPILNRTNPRPGHVVYMVVQHGLGRFRTGRSDGLVGPLTAANPCQAPPKTFEMMD